MIIDRVFSPGLAQVAYLVADEASGDVAVIDPRRDVDAYIDWASQRGLRITAILETHVHADFVSGALELQNATGAPIYSSLLGDQEFEHVSLRDGDRVAVGSIAIEARWTPGHTPEHIVFLLFEPGQTLPSAMFSGDLIFAGEIGRPDLLGSAQTEKLARQLFTTLTARIADLPDDLLIYPGHTAGSSCGKKIGDAATTTLGAERTFTYAFQFDDEQAFIDAVMAEMPAPPPYYPTMKVVNRVGPALLETLPSGRGLSATDVAAMIEDGALVIDAREARRFDQAHIPGSYYAGAGPDFVAWVGWKAPYDRPVVLVLERDDEFAHYANELHRIGIDQVAGYLDGGIETWLDAGHPVDRLEAVTPERFAAMMQSEPNATVLDVRTRDEWKSGHIPAARNTFAGDISAGAAIDASPDDLVLLTCATGFRSRVAASQLQARGVSRIIQLDGGMDAWTNAGLPTEQN